MTVEETFRKFSADKLRQLSGRIQVCLGKLTPEQVWMRNSPNENAVGNLVLHLCGNIAQWIGSGVAGLPDHRQRAAEFEARGGLDNTALAARLQTAVETAAAQIESLPAAGFTDVVTIQNYAVTKLEAIFHVVEHFAEHTGQIIFATKLLTGDDLGFYAHLNKPPHAEKTP